MMSVRGLRSPGITPLRRYYAPVRRPAVPPPSLCIPREPWEHDSPHAGPLRFLCSRSGRAVPLYPGGPDRCVCLCLHDPHGLHRFRPVGRPRLQRFEACMDSLTLRLTPSWHRGFDRLIAHPAARATTCVIGISHDELLAVHEKSTSFLTHLKPLTLR